jgi:uncharacterized protein YcbX
MANGEVVAIFISPVAGDAMQQIEEVQAIAGKGLDGDRYAKGKGSFGQVPGKRQVTLINSVFFPGSGFDYIDCRRNIITAGVELMWLIGREFQIGAAKMRGVKYCDPCMRPTKLSGKEKSFKEAFADRGGLVAEIIESGAIKTGDLIIPPPKGY